ncbi:MAG TPA: acyltransferase [Kribbella sp.]|nr:acyltransferase [Kribbella sp.]
MATRGRGPARGSASGGHGSTVERWASKRLLYLDNLKVILIAAIIVGHGLEGYADIDWWAYSDVREVTLSPVTQAVLLVIGGPFALFLIPLLFLVAGLLTPPSLQRKGPGMFARDRLLRLGLVFAVYVLVLLPPIMYVLEYWVGTDTGPYWSSYLGEEKVFDTGTLWFVGVLLIYSLGYAAWAKIRQGHEVRPWRTEIHLRHLLLLVAAVGVSTFLVRLVFPFNSENKYLDLNFYQWPSCLGVFALGVMAYRQGWLTALPERLCRQCRNATVATACVFAVFTAYGVATGGIDEQSWLGGWDWSAFVFAAIESALTVFAPVWLLGIVQRHLDRPVRWIGPVLSRSAYGAFVLQVVVLIGLAIALRPLPLPAEVKALIVASGGVAGSFALAWLLISRVPGMARVL